MAFDISKLGVKKNIPKVDFKAYSGLLCAPPKFGKTTIASMFPNSVICAFEMGIRGQAVNYVETFTWEALIEFVDQLEENRAEIADNISTIVFDTINKAEEVIEPYILKKQGRLDGKKYTKPTEIPFGGFYTAKDREMRIQIDRIERMGFTILYLTHSRLKTVTTKSGEQYDIYISAMSDRCEKFIYPSVDYILFGENRMIDDGIGGKTLKRVLISNSQEDATAGNRVHFKEDIVFDTEEEAIDKFQKQFRKVIEERLKKAGVTQSIDEIAMQQAEERKKEISSYIESQQQPSSDEMIETIKSKFGTATQDAQSAVVKYLSDAGITTGFKDSSAFTSEQLQDIVDILA
jgi:hypothetical protein